jgi:hypothetical protein
MYPPPPQQQPAIVQHVEPPATPEQATGPQQDGFNVSYPGTPQPGDMEKAAADVDRLRLQENADEMEKQNDAQLETKQGNSKDTEPAQESGGGSTPNADDGYDYYNGIG